LEFVEGGAAKEQRMTAARRALDWVVRPAVEDVSRGQAVAAVVTRVFVGVMWLYNTAWKNPPDFGQSDQGGLFAFTSYAVSNPVFPPYAWAVEHLVLPVFVPFGWMVLLFETLLAVLLLSGSFVRVAALIGLAQSAAIGLSVARAPHEWPWSYALMVLVHLFILFGGAGRHLAVDGLRARQGDGAGLARFWGGLSVLMGLVVVVAGAVTSGGINLRLNGLEFGLGVYNVAGGLVLLVAGAAVLTWSFTRTTVLAWVTGGLAVLAGLLLRVQIGFSTPVLGGDGAAAAYFLTLAVVAFGLARLGNRMPIAADSDDPATARVAGWRDQP